MTQKKTSEIFAACIPLIENSKYGFICHALCAVIKGSLGEATWEEFQEEGHKTHNIVMTRLAGGEHLLGFAYDIQHIFQEIFDPSGILPPWHLSDEELREFRILWLHSLVAEFQQLGD